MKHLGGGTPKGSTRNRVLPCFVLARRMGWEIRPIRWAHPISNGGILQRDVCHTGRGNRFLCFGWGLAAEQTVHHKRTSLM